ncbi:MAG: hypothetical protein JO067_11830 [Cupriavidus sp.]|nr:hypothetical protein [Cupriavidus sp.]
MPFDIKNLPFRPEHSEDQRISRGTKWFDRDAHIEMYATMLDALRSHIGDDWYRLSDEGASFHLGPEMKRTISDLIRKCSESCDHETTVDFVTKGAVREIETRIASRPRHRVLKGDLNATGTVAHEHMCPNSEVFRCLTSQEFKLMTTAEILKLLSFRALVSGPRTKAALRPADQSAWSEVDKLDSAYASKIPTEGKVRELGKEDLLKYYPLLRYHKVGLLDDLIPVTARARRLLPEYRDFMGLLPVTDTDGR